jgi:hypothetical protein
MPDSHCIKEAIPQGLRLPFNLTRMSQPSPGASCFRIPIKDEGAMHAEEFIEPSVDLGSARGTGVSFRGFLDFGNHWHRQKPFGLVKPSQNRRIWLGLPQFRQDVVVQKAGFHLRGGKLTGPMERKASSAALRSIRGTGTTCKQGSPCSVTVSLPRPLITGRTNFVVCRLSSVSVACIVQ